MSDSSCYAKLNPEEVVKSIDFINRVGWVNVATQEGAKNGVCVGLALPETEYVVALAKHLGWVKKYDEPDYGSEACLFVYRVNDSHHDAVLGQAWAVRVLQELEQKIREAKQ